MNCADCNTPLDGLPHSQRLVAMEEDGTPVTEPVCPICVAIFVADVPVPPRERPYDWGFDGMFREAA